MPPIFKALASIAAWILFIEALIGIVWIYVMFAKDPTQAVEQPLVSAAWFAVWMVTLTLSVVAMKLRKTLE